MEHFNKYLKYKNKYLALKNQLGGNQKGALVFTFKVVEDFYHITICYLIKDLNVIYKAVLDEPSLKIRKYFGKNTTWTLGIGDKWGLNSRYVNARFEQENINIDIDTVRRNIVDYIEHKAPNTIDTSRYPETGGMPPAHIASHKLQSDSKYYVTFSLATIPPQLRQ